MKELKQKPPEELTNLLKEKREQLVDLSFQTHQKKVKNVREIRKIKRDIARLLTLAQENKGNKNL